MRLRPTDDRATEVDTLVGAVGERVGPDGVLADLDRRAQAWTAPARFLAEGYRWDRADMRDREWYPQGLTTSADSGAGADTYRGRRIAVVAWYAKRVGDAPSRGSRLSFLDVTDRRSPRYRHVMLVEPGRDERSGAAIEPVRVHAGGIVWLGETMLVADTRGGFRVFDLADILRVDEPDRGGSHYVLPQRRSYLAENDDGAEPFRFSFASVDRSGVDPHLVVGEHATGGQTRRIMLLALGGDDPTAPLALTDGIAAPIEVEDGVGRMQGALTVHGHRYASVSRGVHRRGSVWTWPAGGTPREHRGCLAVGPEDLSYWPQLDQIWCASEEPGRRFVYAVHRSAFDD